jgi:endo-1,4-beta-xylanase
MWMKVNRMLLVAAVFMAATAALVMVGCENPLAASGYQEILDGDAARAIITSNTTGTDSKDRLYYTFWVKGGASGAKMTVDGGNQYKIEWNNCPDMTAGKGWSSGTKNRVVKYNATNYWAKSGGALGVYGWIKYSSSFRSPEGHDCQGIEYYVVEQTADKEGPYNNNDGNFPLAKGTVYSDGDTYDLYTHDRYDDNALGGGKCWFTQWISIRRTKRTSGTVTFQNHYNAWKSAGMKEGTMGYQILLVEGWPAAKGPSSENVGSVTVKIGEGADTPPAAPVLTGSASGWIDISEPYYSFHGYRISLKWNVPQDDLGIKTYRVYVNGQFKAGSNSTNMDFCVTSHGYTYTVYAVDSGGNYSPVSNSYTF